MIDFSQYFKGVPTTGNGGGQVNPGGAQGVSGYLYFYNLELQYNVIFFMKLFNNNNN